jgi:peptidoglycan hydrolase-like amidase
MSLRNVSLRTLVFVCWAGCVLTGPRSAAQDVRVEVFGLFHPHEVNLNPTKGSALTVQTGDQTLVLEQNSGQSSARIRVLGDHLQVETKRHVINSAAIHADPRNQSPTDFVLEVPGKIKRHYSGTLDITVDSGVLLPVVTMDIETAVASVVQAESDPGTPIEALKAQAVAARSYFSATKGRHHRSDFCDTTHCQFLREPPAPNSPAMAATLATRGLVLTYEDRPVSAMYTRSCGGRTKTPAEIGLSAHDYPYFPVTCSYCAQNPFRWSRRLSRENAAGLLAPSEAARLRIDRHLGWDAVPSNNFAAHTEGQIVLLEGTGQGHGVGMCQHGARAMAEHGASFHDILQHYYPNTQLVTTKLNR